VDIKEFWRQYDIADKEHKKWEKRADKVLQRYRLETESGDGTVSPSFNVLWANTSVLEPGLFSQVPKPDITRRYKDDDPVGAQGSKIIERALEFVIDDGDFYEFGTQSVRDYLLPGRTVCKVRYCPTYARVRRAVEVEARGQLGPNGETDQLEYFKDGDPVDRATVRYGDGGSAFIEEEVEEVVDEHVINDRWPWKNFRHQKAKRWQDVGWVDYISYLDSGQLKKMFGAKKAKEIELTVDAAGEERKDGTFNPTHAEVHEVWIARERKVSLAVRGVEDRWMREGEDPLRLDKFFPTPKPLYAVDTNDSLQPIPLFTLYQHQANELDLITKRISVLMRALKMAGLYAGSEKELLQKLFEADENQMIPVQDWGALKASGGVTGLVEWLPIEQVGKVLTALFREREATVAQIFELTGIADIQRGSTDPRETKGSQVIKAQFASRRALTPKQEVERYFRDVLRIDAEIMSEHFSTNTLERMTGLACPPEVRQLLQDELQRQYRIDIETDSTVAPDEEREQANMAKALEAVTAYMEAAGPLAQSGVPVELLLQLLKTYLRKFKWGREVEETIEALERNPPPKQPDPEEKKMQMEMQIEQEKAKLEQQKLMMEMQAKQKELELKLQEMQMKMQFKQAEAQTDLQVKTIQAEADAAIAQQSVAQDQQMHEQQMRQGDESHRQAMQQQKETSSAKNVQVRQGNQRAN